jgi:hypothetical protein
MKLKFLPPLYCAAFACGDICMKTWTSRLALMATLAQGFAFGAKAEAQDAYAPPVSAQPAYNVVMPSGNVRTIILAPPPASGVPAASRMIPGSAVVSTPVAPRGSEYAMQTAETRLGLADRVLSAAAHDKIIVDEAGFQRNEIAADNKQGRNMETLVTRAGVIETARDNQAQRAAAAREQAQANRERLAAIRHQQAIEKSVLRDQQRTRGDWRNFGQRMIGAFEKSVTRKGNQNFALKQQQNKLNAQFGKNAAQFKTPPASARAPHPGSRHQ